MKINLIISFPIYCGVLTSKIEFLVFLLLQVKTQKENTKFYVRGIRNTVDFEYENANYFATKKLKNDVIPVYLPCPQELLHVSSSMVKSSLKFGTPINEYVTKEVEAYIRKIQSEKA